MATRGSKDEFGLDVEALSDWLEPVTSPVVFVGPASFGSRDALWRAAETVSTECRASMLLANVWHAADRSVPDQGAGQSVLGWLYEVRGMTGLPVASAVADPLQVEQCLDAGLDALWIGSRTTGDPDRVKEIADALRGVGIPVMVKNPLNPDIGLWVSAFESLNRVGLKQLAAVHRGFSLFHGSVFRYEPGWRVAIELRLLAPQLPMLCDLSHVAAETASARDIAQTAMDLDMAGLWAEVVAASNGVSASAELRLTPEALESVLSRLELKRTSTDDERFKTQIEQLRSVIDSLDRRLLEALSQRQVVVDRIAECKSEEGVTILQLERWREICQTRGEYGCSLGLDADMIQEVFEVIHNHAIRRQGEKMKHRSGVDGVPPDPSE